MISSNPLFLKSKIAKVVPQKPIQTIVINNQPCSKYDFTYNISSNYLAIEYFFGGERVN